MTNKPTPFVLEEIKIIEAIAPIFNYTHEQLQPRYYNTHLFRSQLRLTLKPLDEITSRSTEKTHPTRRHRGPGTSTLADINARPPIERPGAAAAAALRARIVRDSARFSDFPGVHVCRRLCGPNRESGAGREVN